MGAIDLEDIKSRINISSFAKENLGCQVSLQNTMHCHLHHEKTASLKFYDEAQNYYCFGCHKSGNIFNLIQEIKNYSFREAVKFAAESVGIKIENDYSALREPSEFKEKRELLYPIMKDICKEFEKNLKINADALEYLEERGVTKESIAKFRLGYSTYNSSNLIEILKTKYPDDYHLILESGVFKKSMDKDQEFFNILNNRITFPIFDQYNRVIAFGGRILPNKNDERPKYLNCSDSLIFKKGDNLYGENFARQSIKENKESIIVEGYLDVIIMHQAGFTETIAPLGTAISTTQFKHLWRLSPNIKCALDGDKAGHNAVLNYIKKALTIITAGKFLYFARLPIDSDPASLIIGNQTDELKASLNNPQYSAEIITRVIGRKYRNASAEHLAAMQNEFNFYLNLINDQIVKDKYKEFFEEKIKLIAQKFRNSPQTINQASLFVKKKFFSLSIYDQIFCYIIVLIIEFPEERNYFNNTEVINKIYEKSCYRHELKNLIEYIFIKYSKRLSINDVKISFPNFAHFLSNAEQKIKLEIASDPKKLWLKYVSYSLELFSLKGQKHNLQNEISQNNAQLEKIIKLKEINLQEQNLTNLIHDNEQNLTNLINNNEQNLTS